MCCTLFIALLEYTQARAYRMVVLTLSYHWLIYCPQYRINVENCDFVFRD